MSCVLSFRVRRQGLNVLRLGWGFWITHGVLGRESEVVMEWFGVDPLHQVVSHDEAIDLIPWLSIRWQASPPESGHYI